MASTYTANTGIEKIGSGEQAGTWGTTTNTNFDIIDDALNGVLTLTVSGNTTLTTDDGSVSNGHHKVLLLSGNPSSAFNLTISPNDQQKWYFISNNTAQTATILQGGGSGTTVSMAASTIAIVYADGTGSNANVARLDPTIVDGAVTTAKIADSNVTLAKMAANSVDSDQYVDGSIDAAHLASNSVTTAKIADDAVTSAKLDTNIAIDGTLSLGGTTITSTGTELNIVDGNTSVGTTAISDGDGIVTNDNGTMRQTSVETFSTYFNQNLVEAKSALTVSGTVTVTPSGATSVYQPLTVSSGSQTVRVATTNLVVGQYVIIDKTSSANSMTIDWTNNGAVTSSGISLGSSAELGIGIFNGSGFSFTETVKF